MHMYLNFRSLEGTKKLVMLTPHKTQWRGAIYKNGCPLLLG